MLVNKKHANKEIATVFGIIKFNEKGECHDLTEEQAKVLGKLPGYKYVAPKKTTTKAKSKAEETKETPKKKTTTAKKKTNSKAKAEDK